jgi:hypothetical protein
MLYKGVGKYLLKVKCINEIKRINKQKLGSGETEEILLQRVIISGPLYYTSQMLHGCRLK